VGGVVGGVTGGTVGGTDMAVDPLVGTTPMLLLLRRSSAQAREPGASGVVSDGDAAAAWGAVGAACASLGTSVRCAASSAANLFSMDSRRANSAGSLMRSP
jgi:hypothetical protein